jgi:hypothetical protein
MNNTPSANQKATTWSDFVGKRLLVYEPECGPATAFEYTVDEVSPSGLRVKFKNRVGRNFWTDSLQYRVLEVLS